MRLRVASRAAQLLRVLVGAALLFCCAPAEQDASHSGEGSSCCGMLGDLTVVHPYNGAVLTLSPDSHFRVELTLTGSPHAAFPPGLPRDVCERGRNPSLDAVAGWPHDSAAHDDELVVFEGGTELGAVSLHAQCGDAGANSGTVGGYGGIAECGAEGVDHAAALREARDAFDRERSDHPASFLYDLHRAMACIHAQQSPAVAAHARLPHVQVGHP